MPRVPAPLRPAAAPRRPPVPYPDPVPRPAASRPPRPPRPAPPAPRTPRDRGRSHARGPRAPAAPPHPRRRPVAPQIQLIPASADGALDAADEAVDLLLDSGRAPATSWCSPPANSTRGPRTSCPSARPSYWAQHDAGDDVFYADAAAADRATSRPVVVVAVNGGDDDVAARALPPALARAGALLIVCGDPQQINSVLGAGV